MLVPIFIDTQDIVSQFDGITHDNIDNLCDNIAKGLAAGYAQQLEMEAQKALHQTRKRYIQNIRLIDSGKLEGTVLLDYSKDKLIRMLEEGASAFDMKEGFFNSSKVKFTKDGRKYLTIPFRIGTPGAIGDSDAFSGTMPQEVYEVIKGKVANIPVSGGGMRSQGLVIGDIPSDFQLPKTRPAINNSEGNQLWREYQHKNSLYEGLTKVTDSVTGQNSYQNFRRVSEPGILPVKSGKSLDPYKPSHEEVGSDPDSFIHPGIPAHNLIQVALQNYNVEQKAGELINFELSKLGFEVE